MVVAKRQRREKPAKIEQRKVRGPEWEPQVKQTALLTRPIYLEQAHGGGDKCIKGGSLEGLGPLFSSSFGSAHLLEGVLSFVFPNGTELWHQFHRFNFLRQRDRTEEMTLSPDISINEKKNFCCIWAITHFGLICDCKQLKLKYWDLPVGFWEDENLQYGTLV